jgi:integrase
MVRKKGYIPTHCHHKGKNLGYVSLSGKTLYTGRWGSREADREYERLIAEWLQNARQLPKKWTGDDSYLINHLVADYWRWAEQYYRKDNAPTRELNNIKDAVRPLLDLYEFTEADQFGPLSLAALRQHVVDEGNWARTTINSRINIIRRVFKWAVANEKVPPQVYEGLRSVPGLQRGRTSARETDPVLPVPEEDMRAILPYVSPQVETMILLQWFTGMRPGEVVLMRWKDIIQSANGEVYSPSSHKTEHFGKDREVCLGPKSRTLLGSWLRLDKEAFIFSPWEAERQRRAINREARKTKVTPSQAQRDRRRSSKALRRYNTRYTTGSYRQAIARACKKAKVALWTPNRIRHAVATRIRNNFGMEFAQAVLGHACPTVTG